MSARETFAYVAALAAVVGLLLLLTRQPDRPTPAPPVPTWSEIPVCLDCRTVGA